mgnify:CR=1 FL=1
MAQTVGSSNGSYSLWFPTSVSYMSISTIASFLKKINQDFNKLRKAGKHGKPQALFIFVLQLLYQLNHFFIRSFDEEVTDSVIPEWESGDPFQDFIRKLFRFFKCCFDVRAVQCQMIYCTAGICCMLHRIGFDLNRTVLKEADLLVTVFVS